MSSRATARTPPRTMAGAAARTIAPARTSPRTPVRPDLTLVDPPAASATRVRGRARSAAAARRAPFVLLLVALLVGTTLGLLILNTAIAVDSVKATQLQAQNAERAQEVQRLERLVVAGGAPAQVAAAAVAAGLVPAGTAAYLVIAPDGSVVLRGTPVPAPAPGQTPVDGG